MSRFSQALASSRFVITSEINPPKGTDVGEALRQAESLKGAVTAFNVTDGGGSKMRSSPIAMAHLLLDRGVEPIMEMVCRDRNRIAIQGDLLAANIMGIENILCMSGDPPGAGDHPDAKAVFDLDSTTLIQAASTLALGNDIVGNELKGSPNFFLGGVANPGSPDLDKELKRFEAKIKAGARFFQTQATFSVKGFEHFIRRVEQYKMPVLAGIIPLKSGSMALHLNKSLPGLNIPEDVIEELNKASDQEKKGIEMAARLIKELASIAQGVHIMAMGWENRIPQILEASGVGVRTK